MIVHVEEVGAALTQVKVAEEPDGVNPPRVFELTAMPVYGRKKLYRLELRAGDSMQFAEQDDDGFAKAETLYAGLVGDEAATADVFADRIRTIRCELAALSEEDMPGAHVELGRVLDAWDEFEHIVGTNDGGEREVIS